MFPSESMTSAELNQLLFSIRGATPVTIVAETRPSCVANSPDIRKLAEVNGFLQANYQNSVNRQREREGKTADFKSAGLPWGVQLKETCLIVNESPKDGTPRSYVRIKVESSKEPRYFIGSQEVDYSAVAPYLTKKGSSSRQGVAKQVIPRNYQITPGSCTIKAIAINGRQIEIRDEAVIGTAPLERGRDAQDLD